MDHIFNSIENLIKKHIEISILQDSDKYDGDGGTQHLIETELRCRMERLIRALNDKDNLMYDLKNRNAAEEAESFIRWILHPYNGGNA